MSARIIHTFALICFCIFGAAGCKEEILHDLDELRANQAQLALERASVRVDKVRSGGGWNIRVDSSNTVRSLAVLEKSRLLWRDLSRFKEHSSSLILSREQRAQAAERETAWTLEQTLERIPGVLEARVQLYVQPKEEFDLRKGGERSGSVLLLAEKTGTVDAAQIKQLVSGATGIAAQLISVVVSADEVLAEKPAHEKPQPLAPAPVETIRLSELERRCLAAAAALSIFLIFRIASRALRRRRLRARTFVTVETETSPRVNGNGAYHHGEVF